MSSVTIDKNYTPKLANNFSFVKVNNEQYTICIDNEETPLKLTVNALTKQLLDQIDGNRTIEELAKEFTETNHVNLSSNDLVNIFNKQLLGFGILYGDNTEKIKIKDKYIFLRITLIPSSAVRKITPLFKFLFNRKVFNTLFVGGFLLLTLVYFQNLSIAEFYRITDQWLLLIYMAIIYGSLVLHELGHAAACDRFGAKSGDIGFGFYILTPVFYADMTDAWRLTRSERVIIDLAGIYLQMLFCCLLAAIFYITNNQLFLFISFAIAVTFIFNINPFLRFDGYWALSDLLMIPNLRDRSFYATGFLFGRIIGKHKKSIPTTSINLFLIGYGLMRIVVLFLFIAYMLVFNSESIIYFPINVYEFLSTIITKPEIVDFNFVKSNLIKLLIPFIFYFLIVRSFGAAIYKRTKKS